MTGKIARSKLGFSTVVEAGRNGHGKVAVSGQKGRFTVIESLFNLTVQIAKVRYNKAFKTYYLISNFLYFGNNFMKLRK